MLVTFAALVPGFAVLGYTQYELLNARRQEVRESALQSARQAAFEIHRVLDGVESLLLAVSRAPVVREFDEPACSSYLALLDRGVPHLSGIGVADRAGNVRCGSQTTPRGQNVSDRSYFRPAIDSPALFVGHYILGRGAGLPILPVALGMRDEQDQPIGMVVAALDLTWLGERLRERGLPPGGSLTVSDRSGVIIARHPLPERFVGTRIPDPFMRLVTAPEPGIEEVISQDGTRRVLGFVPATNPPMGLYISVGLSTDASSEAIRRATINAIFFALLGAFATILATWLAGERFFVRPVARMIEALRRWRGGEASARTGFAGHSGEIGRLGAELDRMMDEITTAEEDKQLLAGELLHRVRNTLSMVAAIASATLNRDTPARQLLPDYIGRIGALAKSHGMLTAERWEGADLEAIVRAVVAPILPDDNVRLTASGPTVRLLSRDALAMTLVMHELTTNALKYGALSVPEGRVDVIWSLAGGKLDLTWQERGGPAPPPTAGGRGFGTRLMSRVFGAAGTVTLDLSGEGARCHIELTPEQGPESPEAQRPPAAADGLGERSGRAP